MLISGFKFVDGKLPHNTPFQKAQIVCQMLTNSGGVLNPMTHMRVGKEFRLGVDGCSFTLAEEGGKWSVKETHSFHPGYDHTCPYCGSDDLGYDFITNDEDENRDVIDCNKCGKRLYVED